jgi:hypothetical protein
VQYIIKLQYVCTELYKYQLLNEGNSKRNCCTCTCTLQDIPSSRNSRIVTLYPSPQFKCSIFSFCVIEQPLDQSFGKRGLRSTEGAKMRHLEKVMAKLFCSYSTKRFRGGMGSYWCVQYDIPYTCIKLLNHVSCIFQLLVPGTYTTYDHSCLIATWSMSCCHLRLSRLLYCRFSS